MDTGFVLIVGILLRLGIPTLITLLIIMVFKKLDAKWQAEAMDEIAQTGIHPIDKVVECWMRHDCEEIAREECPAFLYQNMSNVQNFRDNQDWVKEDCFGCEAFEKVKAVGKIHEVPL